MQTYENIAHYLLSGIWYWKIVIFTLTHLPLVRHVCVGQLGPSTLAVPEQLSNGGGENVGHSPAESGTDFCAPLAPPCGH